MLKSFRWKLASTYLLLIIVILMLSGSMVYVNFKNYYLQNLERNLIKEASLVADMAQYVRLGNSSSYQNICDIAARDSAERITIIDKNGTVLGDSSYDKQKMDTHKNRPEVYQALHGNTGIQIRYSDTLKKEMLYVAVPFINTQGNGVVRISMPLSELNQIYGKILSIMLLTLLAVGLVVFLFSLLLAHRFSRPLQIITQAIQEMAEGNFKRRISYHSNDEIGILVQAFNEMGEYVDRGINEISEVKNRLEALLHNTVNGIVMVDMQGRITYANPMAISLLELEDNSINKKYIDIISDYVLLDTIDEVMRKMEPVRTQTIMHALGGKTLELNVVPIESRGIDLQGILVVLNDITELKRLEQVRQDFVANVSHELKTPVAAISGFAETLLHEDAANRDTVREFSQIIYDESQRLARLISSLLVLSKSESKTMIVEHKAVDISSLIEDAIEVVRKRNINNSMNVHFTQPDKKTVLNSDPELITQVLINLLDNAAKYSPNNSVIDVRLEEMPGSIKISVCDQGIGISDQEIPRIFERFYRVDKARSRHTGGTGLGLAIVKHLVENLGGQVGVESNVGQGSTFYFILPM